MTTDVRGLVDTACWVSLGDSIILVDLAGGRVYRIRTANPDWVNEPTTRDFLDSQNLLR